jgi:hypothetical protein
MQAAGELAGAAVGVSGVRRHEFGNVADNLADNVGFEPSENHNSRPAGLLLQGFSMVAGAV